MVEIDLEEAKDHEERKTEEEKRSSKHQDDDFFEETGGDSVFETLSDFERGQRRECIAAAASRQSRREQARRRRERWRGRAADFCSVFTCYVLGACAVALCVYFLFKIFSAIQWSA